MTNKHTITTMWKITRKIISKIKYLYVFIGNTCFFFHKMPVYFFRQFSYRIVYLMICRYSFGEGTGEPLQYSCLETPMDGGAWWDVVHGVAKSHTRLSDFTFTLHFHALEKDMATHSSVLAWRILGNGGAWWAAIYGVAQSQTRLKRLSSSSSIVPMKQ